MCTQNGLHPEDWAWLECKTSENKSNATITCTKFPDIWRSLTSSLMSLPFTDTPHFVRMFEIIWPPLPTHFPKSELDTLSLDIISFSPERWRFSVKSGRISSWFLFLISAFSMHVFLFATVCYGVILDLWPLWSLTIWYVQFLPYTIFLHVINNIPDNVPSVEIIRDIIRKRDVFDENHKLFFWSFLCSC